MARNVGRKAVESTGGELSSSDAVERVGEPPPVAAGSLYARFMTAEEWQMVRAVGEEGLAGEIWVARLVVARLLEQGDLIAVGRMLTVLRGLVAEHRKQTGDQAEGIVAGIQKILDEFNLNEES